MEIGRSSVHQRFSTRARQRGIHQGSTQMKTNVSKIIKHRRRMMSQALISGYESLLELNTQTQRRRYSTGDRYEKPSEVITINVSGSRYQTYLSTLENYPLTLLGDRRKRKCYWNYADREFFFDRNRSCFESILYYYQSNGRLRRPDHIPLDTFIEEVSFFELGSEAMSEINRLENVSFVKRIDLPRWFWRRYIWFYLECPQHSIIARSIYITSMILTIISCVTLAVETLPNYNQQQVNETCHIHDRDNSSYSKFTCTSPFSSPFFFIQTICIVFFTIEFLLRLISTPSYYRFLLSILNWIDLAAIIPYFVLIGLSLTNNEENFNSGSFIGLRLLRSLRFLRIFKVHLIFKQFKSLRVLSSTLKESFVDFFIMMVILTLLAFLFGAATYFAEQDINNTVFDSIPRATYWGIITITTVGYGDMYPVSVIGRIISCLCAILGTVTTGMLVSVLVDRYQRIYSRKRFYPEQIIPKINDSDSEHDQKEDFIRKKLSGLRHNSSTAPNLFQPTTNHPAHPNRLLEQCHYKSPSSHARFIISFGSEKYSDKSLSKMIDGLMIELKETILESGEPVILKTFHSEVRITGT